jgi:SOS-response transcriptional repressor LexA
MSSIPHIVDRKTIFASISIGDDDYSPGMNVHERIRDGRKRLKLTEEEFGAKVGVSRGSVQHWERGATAPSRKRQPVVAALLGLTVAELMSESNVTEVEKAVTSGAVPLISWVQAGDWNAAADPLQPGDAERWLPCPTNHGPNTYALRVRGDSMTAPHGRTYPEACVIYVDPDQRNPINGARIIAKLIGTDEVTFKVYKEEDGRRWLQPLNPSHLPIREAFRVLGTVIGKWEDE